MYTCQSVALDLQLARSHRWSYDSHSRPPASCPCFTCPRHSTALRQMPCIYPMPCTLHPDLAESHQGGGRQPSRKARVATAANPTRGEDHRLLPEEACCLVAPDAGVHIAYTHTYACTFKATCACLFILVHQCTCAHACAFSWRGTAWHALTSTGIDLKAQESKLSRTFAQVRSPC